MFMALDEAIYTICNSWKIVNTVTNMKITRGLTVFYHTDIKILWGLTIFYHTDIKITRGLTIFYHTDIKNEG